VKTLDVLRALVACDSTNPPRKTAAVVERAVGFLRDGGLHVTVTDHDEGCMSVLATRGSSKILLNAHLDTVPVAPGWTREPFALTTTSDRAYGLGACDVKGGAAAMIAAALATKGPAALLLTTDEEAGSATCVKKFLATKPSHELVIVSEPTRARPVAAHRGVATGLVSFEGKAAHSSQRGGRSAVHSLVEWADTALELARELGDVRFNIGRVEGGEKPNVIAARAEARFGVRPPVEADPRGILRRFGDLALSDRGARFEERFVGPPLRSSAKADVLGLPLAEPVDFWTEAALFAEAGHPALVFGPGDIAQAHGPDEFVLLEDLDRAFDAYVRVLT